MPWCCLCPGKNGSMIHTCSIENTTDVVFPRGKSYLSTGELLHPSQNPGLFGVFLCPQVIHSILFMTFLFVRGFSICMTVTETSVPLYTHPQKHNTPPWMTSAHPWWSVAHSGAMRVISTSWAMPGMIGLFYL